MILNTTSLLTSLINALTVLIATEPITVLIELFIVGYIFKVIVCTFIRKG